MKILIHSNAPWVPSGYGQQTALLAPRLAELGHEPAVSAFHGLQGSVTTWNGIRVYPRHADLFGSDVVAGHVRHFGADLVITLTDVWVLDPRVFGSFNTACWMPIDCRPLSAEDRMWLTASKAVPVATSRHGQRMLTDAGFTALHVPHSVDTGVYAPTDQAAVRSELGLPETAFIIGINAANKGKAPSRKAFPQQFEAFTRLRRKHDDAVLLLHTDMSAVADGLDLAALAESFGLPQGSVIWSDQYSYRAGLLDDRYLAAWYNACDVVSMATYGEGFGLPTVEAQACGVPVVAADNSASSELVGSGWKIRGHPHWNAFHRAWWEAPDVDDLTRAYRKAYDGGAVKRRGGQARDFAVRYDVDHVTVEYWKPTLDLMAPAAT